MLVLKIKKLQIIFITCLLFGFFYFYPRFLVAWLGENNIWVSFLYTYGTGLVFFLITIIWIFSRPKSLALRQALELRWLKFIILGFLCMCILQAVWIFMSGQIPVKI